MRKFITIAFCVSIVITVAAGVVHHTSGAGPDKDSVVDIDATNRSYKKGNKFARVLKAPFKAVGRLFGKGRDDNHIRRMTEKDAKEFESATLSRVKDSRSPVAAASDKDASAHNRLARGRTLLDGGQVNEAIAELSSAVSLDPRLSEAHNLLGVAYDRKGLRDHARESYEQALRFAKNDPQILNNLGYSLYLGGDYRTAIDRLKKAVKFAPNDQRILNNLALAQSRFGKHDDALKTFARAGGEYNARLNLAAMMERTGRDTEAIEQYEAAYRLEPTSSTAWKRLAPLYDRLGQREKAAAAKRVLAALERENVASRATEVKN